MATLRIGAVAEVESWMKRSLEPASESDFHALGENCASDEVIQALH